MKNVIKILSLTLFLALIISAFAACDDRGGDKSAETTITTATTTESELSDEDSHEHIWGEWKIETEPTETEPGSRSRVCSTCSKKQTETIPAVQEPEKPLTPTEGLSYWPLNDNTYFLYSANSAKNLEEIVISSTYNGQPVTKLDAGVFRGFTSLKRITVPSSIKEIGVFAFQNCTSLEEVNLSVGTTILRVRAFEGCTSLKSITIPNGVEIIEDGTFDRCSALESVTIPSSVTRISNFAFINCTSLSSITIPGTITTLGKNVFEGCTSLTSVTIEKGVTKIGRFSFRDCSALTDIYFTGSEAEWEAIDKYDSEIPESATIHYNCTLN